MLDAGLRTNRRPTVEAAPSMNNYLRASSYLEGSLEMHSTISEGELNNLGLTCPICLNFFCDAISMPCGHTFCRVCLLQTTRLSPDGRSCPMCRVRLSIPDPFTYSANEAINQKVRSTVPKAEYARRARSIDAALIELQKAEQHSLPVFYMGPGCTVGECITLRLLETQFQLLIGRAVEGKRVFLYGDGVPAIGKYAVVVLIMDARSSLHGRSVVGVGVERVQMNKVWTDETAKGLYYASCACRAVPEGLEPSVPMPLISPPELLPVFYRSSGTGVGRTVALRLCQPRYIMMVRYMMGSGGPERFVYSKYEPSDGMEAVLVGVQRIRWKQSEESHIYLEGKGLQEGYLQMVHVETGTEGLHFAVFVPRTDGSTAEKEQSGCLSRKCLVC